MSYMVCHDEPESEGGADTDMVGIAVVACSRGSGSKSDLWRLARLIGATDHPLGNLTREEPALSIGITRKAAGIA